MILPSQISLGKALGQQVPNCSLCDNKAEYPLCTDHVLWVEKLRAIKDIVKLLVADSNSDGKKHRYMQLVVAIEELGDG